jgi:hypothetical protein
MLKQPSADAAYRCRRAEENRRCTAVGRALDEGKRGYWVCPMTPSAAGSTT